MKFKWTLVVSGTLLVLALWLTRMSASDALHDEASLELVRTDVEIAALPSATTEVVPVEVTVASIASAVQGDIHFVRHAASADVTQLNVDVRYGLGVWLPRNNELRILLLERSPADGDVAQITQALASSAIFTEIKPTYALLTLRFQANAQAFDRSELEVAQLLVTNNHGATSAANILNSLEWQGSLPSRNVVVGDADAATLLQLSATGKGQSDDEAWDQSWQLNVMVAVRMIE